MARIARIVASGVPHHITQGGNRRQPVFFSDLDYQTYLELFVTLEQAGRLGDMGLLPHAQSRAYRRNTTNRSVAAQGLERSTPPILASHQFSRRLARISVARPFCLVSDGR